MRFELITRWGFLREEECQKLEEKFGTRILEAGIWRDWSDGTDGSGHSFYFHAQGLTEGLTFLDELKQAALHPSATMREHLTMIDGKESSDYFREKACRLDTAVRAAIRVVRSGRNRDQSWREQKARQILKAAL